MNDLTQKELERLESFFKKTHEANKDKINMRSSIDDIAEAAPRQVERYLDRFLRNNVSLTQLYNMIEKARKDGKE